MSQFQQPQDNRYVRPGVLDLGTGRQFDRLSVSQRGEGSIGSGANGGGWVQGQSRTGTGLSGVDPLAQILGTASQAISNFQAADKAMAEAVDRQANKRLDEYQEEFDVATAEGTGTPGDRAKALREKLDGYEAKYGKLPQRGTAQKRFNEMRSKAQLALEDYDFRDEFSKWTAEELTPVLGLPGKEEAAIEAFRGRYRGGPDEMRAIEATQESLNSAISRRQANEDKANSQVLQARWNTSLERLGIYSDNSEGRFVPNPDKIIELAGAANPPIDLSDPDALIEFGTQILMSEVDVGDLPQRSQELYYNNFASFIAEMNADLIPSARYRMRMLEEEEENRQHTAGWHEALKANAVALPASNNPITNLVNTQLSMAQGLANMTPQQQELNRLKMVTSFGKTAKVRYSNLDPAERNTTEEGRASRMLDFLEQDSLAVAATLTNPEDAIQVLADSRAALPLYLHEAKQTGFISPDSNMTEEQWELMRDKLDNDLRLRHAKAYAPHLDAALNTAVLSGDFAMLGRLNEQVRTLTEDVSPGLVGPFGMLEDGSGIDIPAFGPLAVEYGTLGAALLKAKTTMEGNASKGKQGNRMLTMLGVGFADEVVANGENTYIPRSHVEDARALNAVTINMGDALAEGKTVDEALDVAADNLMQLQSAVLATTGQPTDAFNAAAEVIGQIRGLDLPEGIATGLVDASMIAGFHNSKGLDNFADKPAIFKAIGTKTDQIFANTTNPAIGGTDGDYIAALWQRLGTFDNAEQLRKAVFKENYQKAEITAGIITSQGVEVNGKDVYTWKGAKSPIEFNRTEALKGFERLQKMDPNKDYMSVADDVLRYILDPEEWVMENAGSTGIPSDIEMALGALKDMPEHLQNLREMYDIPEGMSTERFLRQVADDMMDELQVSIAMVFGNDESDARASASPEGMAGEFSTAITAAIHNVLEGKTIMQGRDYSDPTGSLQFLIDETGRKGATPGKIAGRVLETSLHSMAANAGYELDPIPYGFTGLPSDDTMKIYEKAFDSAFPGFRGDVDFADIWAARPQGMLPDRISLGDLVLARLSFETAGDGKRAPITMTGDVIAGASLQTNPDGSITFGFKGTAQELTYMPLSNVEGKGLAVLGKPANSIQTGIEAVLAEVGTDNPQDASGAVLVARTNQYTPFLGREAERRKKAIPILEELKQQGGGRMMTREQILAETKGKALLELIEKNGGSYGGITLIAESMIKEKDSP